MRGVLMNRSFEYVPMKIAHAFFFIAFTWLNGETFDIVVRGVVICWTGHVTPEVQKDALLVQVIYGQNVRHMLGNVNFAINDKSSVPSWKST
jgi:hypothetical protein